MFRVAARDFENAIVQHDDTQLPESYTGSDQDFVHVVETKASCLFNPIFNEGIAQSVLSLSLGKIRAFNDETIFAHFGGLDVFRFLDERSALTLPLGSKNRNRSCRTYKSYRTYLLPNPAAKFSARPGVLPIQRLTQSRKV